MDFDHVRGVKAIDVSLLRYQNPEYVKAEAAKCEVVCSNCHRARTYARRVKQVSA